jgi:RNA polymerase sigma-70 factor (ECF subfamily)
MSEQDFSTLLERARAGDPGAMEKLVEEYKPQVERVAHRLLGPALRAALDSTDLVQSVHRSLLLGLKRNKFTFAGPQDLIALAVTMVKRKVARKWARLQRENEYLRLRALLLSRVKPEKAAEVAEKVQDLLETLEDSDRLILQLYLEGYSTMEAADVLGLNPNSLRVRRSRLFRKFGDSGVDLD